MTFCSINFHTTAAQAASCVQRRLLRRQNADRGHAVLACLTLAVALTLMPTGATAFEHVVLPSRTDPLISDVYATNGYHVFGIETSAVPAQGQLHLFLPGTGGIPLAYVNLLRASVAQGYHTIGLNYMNVHPVNTDCAFGGDLSCHQNVRLETIDGIDRSDLLVVSREDSIEHRLIRLLSWLETNALLPITTTQGWGQYLQGTNIVWSNIIVAGHSQGAGHAALIAKTRRVARCDMYAWGDFIYTNMAGRPADWLYWTSATPVEAYFGFMHGDDDQALSNIVTSCWTVLGMDDFGEIVAVESNGTPYGMSHRLMTWTAPEVGGTTHGSVAVDSSTPLTGTNAVFQPVWDYMLAAPELAPMLGALTGLGTEIAILFQTMTGSSYQMQRTTDFVNYTDLGPLLPGDGMIQTSLVSSVVSPAFYRVQIAF